MPQDKIQHYYNLQSEAMIARDMSKMQNGGVDPFNYQADVDKFTKKLKELGLEQ